MNLHIMTWNTGLSEMADATFNMYLVDCIIQYIKAFLEQENSIVVLQQLPFRQNDLYLIVESALKDYFWAWHPISKKKHGCQTVTAVITKMKGVTPFELLVYPNRDYMNRASAVAIESAEQKRIVMLGCHAAGKEKKKTDMTGEKEDKTDMKGKKKKVNKTDMTEYLGNLNNCQNADIILGDFNAGDYERASSTDAKIFEDNRKAFRSLLRDTHVCICNMPTRVYWSNGKLQKTCIDHIFVKRGLVTACSNLIVHEEIKYSDHYPITVEIEL